MVLTRRKFPTNTTLSMFLSGKENTSSHHTPHALLYSSLSFAGQFERNDSRGRNVVACVLGTAVIALYNAAWSRRHKAAPYRGWGQRGNIWRGEGWTCWSAESCMVPTFKTHPPPQKPEPQSQISRHLLGRISWLLNSMWQQWRCKWLKKASSEYGSSPNKDLTELTVD